MQNDDQFSLWFWDYIFPNKEIQIYKDIIIDRGSKYTVVVGAIEKLEDIKIFIKELNKDNYFRKSTHNTYAYRLKDENNLIIEGKNDDGETWAGMCILRELQRANFLNGIVVVTRYFGWVQLHTDRFKNVIEATKKVLVKK